MNTTTPAIAPTTPVTPPTQPSPVANTSQNPSSNPSQITPNTDSQSLTALMAQVDAQAKAQNAKPQDVANVKNQIMNRYGAYEASQQAPQAAPASGNWFTNLIGSVTQPIADIDSTLIAGSSEILGGTSSLTGGLLNKVGLKSAGNVFSSVGSGITSFGDRIIQQGLPTVNGGSALPAGASQGYKQGIKESATGNTGFWNNVGGETGAVVQAGLQTGSDLATLASYAAGNPIAFGALSALSKTASDLSNGSLTDAGTWGKSLLDGVVNGTISGAAAYAGGLILGKAMPALYQWSMPKIVGDVAYAKIGGYAQNFLGLLMSKGAPLLESGVGESVGSHLDSYVKNSFNVVEDGFTKNMDGAFSLTANTLKDDVEPTTDALLRSQQQAGQQLSKLYDNLQAGMGNLKDKVTIPTETILSDPGVSSSLTNAKKTISTLESEGYDTKQLSRYVGQFKALLGVPTMGGDFTNATGITSGGSQATLGTLSRLSTFGRFMQGSTPEETRVIGNLANDLDDSITSALTKSNPEALAAWQKFSMESRNLSQNVYSPFYKSYKNTAQMGAWMDKIMAGAGPTATQLENFKGVMGADPDNAFSSLLFNTALKKAGSLGANDGADFIDSFIGKYGSLLSSDNVQELQNLSGFGHQTLNDAVGWVKQLAGMNTEAGKALSAATPSIESTLSTGETIKAIKATGFVDDINNGNYGDALKTLLSFSEAQTKNPAFVDSISSLMNDEQRSAIADELLSMKGSKIQRASTQLARAAISVAVGSPGGATLHGAFAGATMAMDTASDKIITATMKQLLQEDPQGFMTKAWINKWSDLVANAVGKTVENKASPTVKQVIGQ